MIFYEEFSSLDRKVDFYFTTERDNPCHYPT